MVRELIEETTGEDLSMAISRLLLRPLDISGARIVRTRADLAGVAMESASSYIRAGSITASQSVLYAMRPSCSIALMTGALLPPDLLEASAKRAHSASRIRGVRGIGPAMAGVDERDRVQRTQGDGSHRSRAGQRHRRLPSTRRHPMTAAAFAFGDDLGQVEKIAFQPRPIPLANR